MEPLFRGLSHNKFDMLKNVNFSPSRCHFSSYIENTEHSFRISIGMKSMANNTDTDNSLTLLQVELEQKEELISALTDRLSETADQLDRMRRSGGSSRTGGTGVPAELVDKQTQLTDQLESALTSWDESLPIERMDRMQESLDEILSKIQHGVAVSHSENGTTANADTAEVENKSTEDDSVASEPETPMDFWEAAKARMMADEPGTDANASKPAEAPKPVEADTPVEPESEEKSESAEAVEELPIPQVSEPPVPEDYSEDAERESLLDALKERDKYIQYVISRLRTEQKECRGKIPWTELLEQPTDLTAAVEELQQQLNEQLKNAEIANSLERAAMGRERAKLFQVKQHLEQQIRRLGLTSQMEIQDESAEQKSESRWTRLFSK